jgi:mannobiose 2-epimerase
MKYFTLLYFLFLNSIAFAQKQNERLRTSAEMETSIQTELLNKWYPQCVDTLYGGFLSTFTYDFKPTGPQDKFIVTQARHIWSSSKAALRYPDVPYYKSCAQHGFHFLRDVMWDKTYGGFYTLVNRQGHVKDSTKNAYGNAFGVYALAAYYESSHDTSALNLAQQAFLWLEKHSHDPINKGYYQHLQRDGTPIQRTANISSTSDLGYKDQNSSIHLLEALRELYAVWPNALVRERLYEMLLLVRDTMVTKKGYLTLFFKPDWTPVSFRDSSYASVIAHRNLDHVSFGHDVETAYLMLEASHALNIQNDTTTLSVGKRMVDHALHNGWDDTLGGFYDEGYYFKNKSGIIIIKHSKNWWAQAEGLNTLLIMSDLFPNDAMHYSDKFNTLWKYTQTYLIDHTNGDWYEEGLDKEPERKTALKGHIWKATYHQFRALMNCVDRLKEQK